MSFYNLMVRNLQIIVHMWNSENVFDYTVYARNSFNS